MGVNVDTINMNITITESDHLTFDGHFVRVDEDDGLTLWCTACGEQHSFEQCPDGLYKWESILYLLGQFPESCDGDGKDLESRIRKAMEPYVGKPADQGRIAALENDIRDIVGDEVPLNLQT